MEFGLACGDRRNDAPQDLRLRLGLLPSHPDKSSDGGSERSRRTAGATGTTRVKPRGPGSLSISKKKKRVVFLPCLTDHQWFGWSCCRLTVSIEYPYCSSHDWRCCSHSRAIKANEIAGVFEKIYLAGFRCVYGKLQACYAAAGADWRTSCHFGRAGPARPSRGRQRLFEVRQGADRDLQRCWKGLRAKRFRVRDGGSLKCTIPGRVDACGSTLSFIPSIGQSGQTASRAPEIVRLPSQSHSCLPGPIFINYRGINRKDEGAG